MGFNYKSLANRLFFRGRFIVISLLIIVVGPLTTISTVKAADLESAYIRFDRMTASTATNVLVVFKVPAGNTGTEANVIIEFGAGTTVAASTINTTGLPAGVTALPGTFSTDVFGQQLSITGVTNLTASTTYGFNIATGITSGTAGQYVHTIYTLTSGLATIDSKKVATRVVSGSDQIVVSAVVPPTFSFSFGGNTDSFTTDLDPEAVVSTTGVAITIITNAANGWIAWVKSDNAGLTSATASDTIASAGTVNATPTTLSTGSEDYVLDVDKTDSATSGTGTVTVDAEYNGTTTSQGGTLVTTLTPIATADGPTDGDVLTLIERATISGLTQAATDYTDTLTVVGAGNF